jgi:hypothetical protein
MTMCLARYSVRIQLLIEVMLLSGVSIWNNLAFRHS